MENIHIAAIDIGSNAVRLMIKEVTSDFAESSYRKLLLVRVPIRLGQDTFTTGAISELKLKKMVRLMKSFKHLMKVYDVSEYRACATSAMRDASNAKEVIKELKKETDIKIDVISGQEEAAIIYECHFADLLNKKKNYIYVDVGGGSTEISLIVNGNLTQSKSYNVGTVRMLNQKVAETEYNRLLNELSELSQKFTISEMIGSGGNINKLHTLAVGEKNRNLPLKELIRIHEELTKYTVEELIDKYKMKPDRADVINHAATIYIDVAKAVNATNYIVPTIGLADGIIHLLGEKLKAQQLLANNGIWL